MTKNREKILKEFEEYLSDKEITGSEKVKEEWDKFVEMRNTNPSPKKGKDAWDYLKMALETDDIKKAVKYAKKALQLEKNFLDAEVLIEELTTINTEELKLKYEKLIVKTEKRLKEAGIWTDENIGHFYTILETRPYMRLRNSYLQLLIDQGKLGKALKECEELLLLSENDNLGVRYILMSLYAFFEDEKSANRLFKKYGEDISTQMLFPLIALYYKLDNYKKAELYLKKLSEVNDELVDFFCLAGTMDELELEMDKVINSEMYRLGSKEEIIIAMNNSAFLYTTTTGLLLWMAERILPL